MRKENRHFCSSYDYKKNDGGILSQKKVPINKGDTLWKLYDECFDASIYALLDALDKIRNNDFSEINNGYNSS